VSAPRPRRARRGRGDRRRLLRTTVTFAPGRYVHVARRGSRSPPAPPDRGERVVAARVGGRGGRGLDQRTVVFAGPAGRSTQQLRAVSLGCRCRPTARPTVSAADCSVSVKVWVGPCCRLVHGPEQDRCGPSSLPLVAYWVVKLNWPLASTGRVRKELVTSSFTSTVCSPDWASLAWPVIVTLSDTAVGARGGDLKGWVDLVFRGVGVGLGFGAGRGYARFKPQDRHGRPKLSPSNQSHRFRPRPESQCFRPNREPIRVTLSLPSPVSIQSCFTALELLIVTVRSRPVSMCSPSGRATRSRRACRHRR